MRSSVALPILFVAALTLVYLVSILGAGSSEGGVAFGALRGIAGYEHLQPAAVMQLVARQTSKEHGGWFPLRVLEPALWYAFPSSVAAKALALALVVANVASFAALVARMTRSAAMSALAGIGTLLALQLRKPHDAVLSGSFGLPIAFQLVLMALIAYSYFTSSRKRRFFAVALVLEASACAIDESALLLALAFPILDLLRLRRVGTGALVLLAPALAIAVTHALHLPAPASLRWVAGDPQAGFSIALQQLVAVVPTSYRAFGNVVPDGVPAYFYDTRFDAIGAIDGFGWIAALAASLAVYLVTARGATLAIERRARIVLALFAALLLLVAAFVHDPLEWRRGLRLGEAFPSIYVGCFGFGALFGIAASALSGLRRASLRAVVPVGLSLAVFAIVYGNARTNGRVVALDRNVFETINLIASAGKRGIFESLPSDADIAFDADAQIPDSTLGTYRDPKYLLYLASGRRFAVVDARHAAGASALRRLWIVRRESAGLMAGGLTVAHVQRIRDGRYLVDRAVVYHRYPSSAIRDDFASAVRQAGRGIRYLRVDTPGADLVARVRRTCGAVAVERVYVADDPEVAYGSGFFEASIYKRWDFWATNYLSGSGNAEEQQWRYGAARSVLVVRNAGCNPEPLRLRGTAYAAAPGKLSITAPGLHATLRLGAEGAQIDVVIPPTSLRRFNVAFVTNAPPAQEDLGYPHFLSDARGPARLVFLSPTIAVVHLLRHG